MSDRRPDGTEPVDELVAEARRAGPPPGRRPDPRALERPPAPRSIPSVSAGVQDAIVRWVLRSGGYRHLL